MVPAEKISHGTLRADHRSVRSDDGFSAGLAIGVLLLVVVLLVILVSVPIGGGTDAKPLINIRF
jgi:hypothetical protein